MARRRVWAALVLAAVITAPAPAIARASCTAVDLSVVDVAHQIEVPGFEAVFVVLANGISVGEPILNWYGSSAPLVSVTGPGVEWVGDPDTEWWTGGIPAGPGIYTVCWSGEAPPTLLPDTAIPAVRGSAP